jgi:hypothetical protein
MFTELLHGNALNKSVKIVMFRLTVVITEVSFQVVDISGDLECGISAGVVI